MNGRNKTLLVVWLVLLGAVIAIERPWEGDAFAQTRAAIRPLFPGLRAQLPAVGRVEISSAGTQTSLVRLSDRWVVAERFGHPADTTRLVRLLESVAALTNRNTVSDNPERREQFAVAEENGTRIRFFNVGGEVIADLISGGLKPQAVASGGKARLEFFVRRADSDEVALVAFQPPVVAPRDWLAAQPVEGLNSPGQVRWIERAEEDAWRIVRVGEGGNESWRMVSPDDSPVQVLAAEGMASAFAGLRVLDVVAALEAGQPPNSALGFGEASFSLGLGTGQLELRFGSLAPEGGRYAWLSHRDFVYRVPDYLAQELRKTVDDLVP